jgi:ABC-2 type transport system ATP-binding protein
MIKARGLTKRYSDKLAVDQLTFTVEPGRITGFLSPNGAGKTTTIRLILGLDQPTEGSAYHHLRCLAQTNGLPRTRLGGQWGDESA